MKRMFVPLFFLMIGAVSGYFGAGFFQANEITLAESANVTKKALADKGNEASLKSLRARVAELERMLAEKAVSSVVSTNQDVVERRDPPAGPEGWRARMENLKETDPERYTQMTNRMAQWRQQRVERQQAKLDYLASIDTSRMSPKARQVHAALQDAIIQRDEIEQKLHDENISDEQRRSIFEELRASDRELGRLNQQERNNLIAETAKALGFKGDEVKEISVTMAEIIEATDGGRRWHGGRGMPPPPGNRR